MAWLIEKYNTKVLKSWYFCVSTFLMAHSLTAHKFQCFLYLKFPLNIHIVIHSVGIVIIIILVNVYIIIELRAIPITLKLLMFQVTCPGCLYRPPFYIVQIHSIIQYRSLLDLFNGGKKTPGLWRGII